MIKTRICLLLLLSAAILISSCSTVPDFDQDQPASKINIAVMPAPKAIDWWSPRHIEIKNRVSQGNVDLLMIGDSITHHWENSGKEIWDRFYAPRNAVNMGFAGDRTQNVLWRLDNGELDGVSPKLAVLMIGTNNSNGDDHTATEISEGIVAICERIRNKLPSTRILLLAIFPRGDKAQSGIIGQPAMLNDQWRKNNEASRLASRIADGKTIFYLDINSAFLDDNGVLTRDTMPDLLHPNKKGYEAWARAMEPTVAKLMENYN